MKKGAYSEAHRSLKIADALGEVLSGFLRTGDDDFTRHAKSRRFHVRWFRCDGPGPELDETYWEIRLFPKRHFNKDRDSIGFSILVDPDTDDLKHDIRRLMLFAFKIDAARLKFAAVEAGCSGMIRFHPRPTANELSKYRERKKEKKSKESIAKGGANAS